jgi:DNA-binding transcriptional LysR family regulator
MSRISIQQIETFLAAANARSISAAARGLYISQPSASAILHDMELALGAKLFCRSNKGAELTAEGQRIYAELDPVYKRFQLAADRIFDAGRRRDAQGERILNIGAFHDLDVIRFMRAACAQYARRHPERITNAEYFNHNELRDKLLCEELDVIFTFSFEVTGRPEFDCRRLRSLEQFFVLPAAWNFDPAGDFGALRDRTLIMEPSSGRETLLDICRAHGFTPRRIKYVGSYLLLARMIADGEGFGVSGRNLPNKSALAPFVSFVPVAAKDCNEYAHVVAAWRRDDESEKRESFIEVLNSPKILRKPPFEADEAPGSKWYK